jgi:hypothetical protein
LPQSTMYSPATIRTAPSTLQRREKQSKGEAQQQASKQGAGIAYYAHPEVQGLVEEDGAEHRDEDDDERAEHGHVEGPPLPQAPRHERERETGRHDALHAAQSLPGINQETMSCSCRSIDQASLVFSPRRLTSRA